VGRGKHRVGSPDVSGGRVPVSMDFFWFLAGIFIGTFVGIGATVVFAWKVMRGLVRLAVLAQENRARGGSNSGPKA
jgi:hypothetical protein